MKSAIKTLIDLLRATKYSRMSLWDLEKRITLSGVLGMGVKPTDILKDAIDQKVCTYDPEERMVYLSPKFMTSPLIFLLESDPRRRHLYSRLPVHRVVWNMGMPLAKRKVESTLILKNIPTGHAIAADRDGIIIAYSETLSSLIRFLNRKKISGIRTFRKSPPDAIHIS